MPTLNGDELNRVGGRLITAKEVERSKQCTSQSLPLRSSTNSLDPVVILLQSLFNSLIHSSDVAVTPETELAYLALVPSKEEEAKAPIETIVIDDDDDEDLHVTKLPTPVSPSVLGKRGSEHLDTNGMHLEAMAIDSDLILDADSMVVDSRRRSPSALLAGDDRPVIKQRTSDSPSSSMPELADPEELTTKAAEDGVVEIGVPSDIEMATMAAGSSTPFPVPPPLPPRGPRNRKTSDLGTEVSNYMTFGAFSFSHPPRDRKLTCDWDCRATERRD
jgi:ubiquitin carboxyl-terminal hydrolase 25/28